MGTLISRLFHCHHKRLTFPITPVRKSGVPSSQTYVVCLDCGKQFIYDWGKMRTGEVIDRSLDAGVLPPDVPNRRKGKLKYTLIGSALSLLSLAVLWGNNLMRSQSVKRQPKLSSVDRSSSNDAPKSPQQG